MAADSDRVYLSAEGRIRIADARGTLTDAPIDLSETGYLAITPDGTRLYATLRNPTAVVEIDTADFTVLRRMDLSAYSCLGQPSLAGDHLWVAYWCGRGEKGGVLGLDLSAAAPEPVVIAEGVYYDTPHIAAGGSTLVVGMPGAGKADLMVYDVSTTPATLRGTIDSATSHYGYLRDLAITPDGSMVIAPVEDRYEGWDTTSLTKIRTFAGEPAPGAFAKAVAVSPDGEHLAGGSASPGSTIALYDTATAERTHTYNTPFYTEVTTSVAFTGSNDVVSLTVEMTTGRLYLWRLDNVFLPSTTLTLTPPSTGTAYEPLTLTGRLTLPDGATPGTQPIVVTRSYEGGQTTLPSVTTADDGTFTVSDIPPAGGWFSYKALWEGDSNYRGSISDWASVTLAKHESSITLSGPAEAVVGEEIRVTGKLDTGAESIAPGASLTVKRAIRIDDRIVSTFLPEVTAAADGSFAFTDTPPRAGKYIYQLTWAGDGGSLKVRAQHLMLVGEAQ
ncbi:hypothetical protein IL992_21160 [Microbispora sp. NEAU-D428]|uniref:hypothetical protein n=1 Tax=Microbispora sitophila TaxID=2771537 RepID=UPI001868EA9B|nr:hypothetical protein [Microbispora sitophila]MBE3011691.1 hypothetical protein [Microbispora sitophila]